MGLLLLSKHYVGKPWPMLELLSILEQRGKALPVLLNLSTTDLKKLLRDQMKV